MLLCCFFIPVHGLLVIFFHSSAIDVTNAQVSLRCDVPLFSSQGIPFRCFFIILFYHFSPIIETSYVVLGIRMMLAGCFHIPFKGFGNIFINAQAIIITSAEIKLCPFMAAFSSCAPGRKYITPVLSFG